MEQSVKVFKVDRIASRDLVVLRVANGKPAIIRNSKQFLQDLKNSYLISDNVENIKHPEVNTALRQLKRFTATGDISFHKKGEKWTVTENSSVLKDKKHPMHGKVVVGDQLEYTADQTRVEGFLDLELNATAQFNRDKAEAFAVTQMLEDGAFAFGSSSSDVNASYEDDALNAFDNIPDDIMNEIGETVSEEEGSDEN